jgi:tetratricopeptide (TPR) repeat protein
MSIPDEELTQAKTSNSETLPPPESVLANLGIDPAQIKFIKPRWKRTHYRAIVNWITKYQPQPNACNLEKVRGYLEAFHHICEVEDWEKASKILCLQNNLPPNEELHNQLGVWGYYREQISLYTRLLKRLNTKVDSTCLNGLGSAYDALGDYCQALNYIQQAFHFAKEIGDRSVEATSLGNLASIYLSLADYRQAMEYSEKSLTIAREIGDRAGEGNALGNLGCAYQSLGDYPQAIDYHHQHLLIARTIGDRHGEATALSNLGETFIKMEVYSEAQENLQVALEICRSIGDRYTKAHILKSLADLHQKLGDRVLALDYCTQALTISTELGIPLAQDCQKLTEILQNEARSEV